MAKLKWSEEETIVTLDFYHSHYPSIPGHESQEMEELSDTLRKIRQKLGQNIKEEGRSVHSVYMKLMNFLHCDPNYKGEGLSKVTKLDKRIFKEFENDKIKLSQIAKTIKGLAELDENYENLDIDDEKDFEIQEGKLFTLTHRYRERDRKIVSKKKQRVLKDTGRLQCEGCGFDFKERYGDHGEGFIECHHTTPISEIKVGEKTNLDDLSLLCSNCHRMIHRRRPWLTIEELKQKLCN